MGRCKLPADYRFSSIVRIREWREIRRARSSYQSSFFSSKTRLNSPVLFWVFFFFSFGRFYSRRRRRLAIWCRQKEEVASDDVTLIVIYLIWTGSLGSISSTWVQIVCLLFLSFFLNQEGHVQWKKEIWVPTTVTSRCNRTRAPPSLQRYVIVIAFSFSFFLLTFWSAAAGFATVLSRPYDCLYCTTGKSGESQHYRREVTKNLFYWV